LVGVGDGEEATEIRIAAEIAGDEDQLVTVDLERAADDGLDAELAASLEVAHRTVHAAAVGDRESGHLKLGRPHRKLVWMRAAVQEREVGMGVKLYVGRHCLRGGSGVFCAESSFRPRRIARFAQKVRDRQS